MMSINVCGIGVVSAIGVGCEQNLDSLRSQRCGIADNRLFDTTIDVPVGAVPLNNEELKEMLGVETSLAVSRTALLGALAAREAMSGVEGVEGKRVGFINSTTVGGMDLTEGFYRDFSKDSMSGQLNEVVGHDCATSTKFIAKVCNITGFATTLSTACSSAANAVIMGARMLERGMLDYVLVGGVDSLCRFTLCGFSSLMILDGELCRPFDQSRKGLNLGEGAGYLLLTKESTPTTYCTLAGYANANDAFHQTASSEDGEGAYRAMMGAIKYAEIEPQQIDYINLHGTGTNNNDSSESAAIKRVFEGCETTPPCSSTKGYTGHTLAASGGVEAVYSVLALKHGVLYSSLRVQTPIEGGVTMALQPQEGVALRYILTSSFGFGGNCSSLIFSKK